MNDDVEKRLHRVQIQLNKEEIKCPYSLKCPKSVDGKRCNFFYKKCSIFKRKEKNKST